jgi:hypothetical protein
VPSLLGAQTLQQKPLKVAETHVLVFQTVVRSKAGEVTERRFIPEAKSKKYYELYGMLETFDPEGVVISQDEKKERYVIPWSVIRKLEIKHERKSKAGTGALVGLLVGGTAGGIIGSQTQFCIFDCTDLTGFGIAAGSLGGLLVGATVGAALGADTWEKLPLDDYQALERRLLQRQ